MKKVECSVVVVSYNPKLDSVLKTLESIIIQKNVVYEIIITDDGSENNLFDIINDFFAKKEFKDYILVDNEQNRGIVSNVISGLEIGRGKYVRCIAPGDLLYDENTLRKIVDCMEKSDAVFSFGRMVHYSCKQDIKLYEMSHPHDLIPYLQKEKKYNKMKKHLLIYRDYISGASYSWDREYYLMCLKQVEGRVSYQEDLISVYPIIAKQKICFMNEYVVWYEYDSGISTGSSAKWFKLLKKDRVEFYSWLFAEFQNDLLIKRAYIMELLDEKTDIWSRIKRKLLLLDRTIYSKVYFPLVQQQKICLPEKQYLKDIILSCNEDIKTLGPVS